MMIKNTTIQISMNTKTLLDKLKVHPREPYEDVIKKLIGKRKPNNEKNI